MSVYKSGTNRDVRLSLTYANLRLKASLLLFPRNPYLYLNCLHIASKLSSFVQTGVRTSGAALMMLKATDHGTPCIETRYLLKYGACARYHVCEGYRDSASITRSLNSVGPDQTMRHLGTSSSLE